MKRPKVALIHDYLLYFGGAEETLEAILEIFPDADIYTSVYKPDNFSDAINSKNVIAPKGVSSAFQLIPIFSKYFTFLKPLVFESFDLDGYDLIISDSASYAKGVLTKPDQLHISYIHTPPRFLYGYSVESTKRTAWYYYPVVMVVDHFLRVWDHAAAQRPDYLVANSKEIQGRIKKFYNRDSTIIYPPVELAQQKDHGSNDSADDYYLIAGRMVAYKNFDVVIKAFNLLPDFKLKVIGSGAEEKRLKEMASDNVEFLGRVDDKKKHEVMDGCLGLINAVQDEDFGIVPIEVLSHGHPVLAHRSAGHLETVLDGITGMLFDDLDPKLLAETIKEFDNKVRSGNYDETKIKEHAAKFSKGRFKKDFHDFVMEKWGKHQTKVDKKAK